MALSKRQKIGFKDKILLNAGQKYCRMLQGDHSAILSTFIKLSFVIKIFVWSIFEWTFYTVFTCVKWPLSKRQKIGFQDQVLLNAGQKYCRMLQGEHSAILSTFIKLSFVIKNFVLPIFEWLFYTGFTVHKYIVHHMYLIQIQESLLRGFCLGVLGVESISGMEF